MKHPESIYFTFKNEIRGQPFTWVWISKILNDSSKRNLVVLMHFWWEYQQQTKIIVKMIERWFSVNNFLSRLDLISFFFVLSFFSYWHMWKEIFSRQDPIFNARSVEIFYLNCRTFACIIGQFSFFQIYSQWVQKNFKLHFNL